MNDISVCLSPDLLHLEDLKGKIVVVIDIFRASTCMVAGLANEVEEIIPVATVEECLTYKDKNYFLAGERNADKVEGFDLDNSPYSYMQEGLKGKKIAMTTTNGTNALNKAKNEAYQVIIGAFLNEDAVVNYLKNQSRDVVMLCSGWKGKVNLEDTLFAGAVCYKLRESFSINEDAALISIALFEQSKGDYRTILVNSSHYKRLVGKGVYKDLEFALKEDVYSNIPVLIGNKLVNIS